MGKVKINELTVFCNIGVKEDERTHEQPVILNITLFLDLAKARQTDRIEDTVDYYHLAEEIEEGLRERSFSLLEALAGTVGNLCLGRERVDRVKVSARKPQALEDADSSEVEICMSEKC